MPSRLLRLILMWLLFLASISSFADSNLLRFNAVSSGWPPYAFLDDKGQATGILVDALPLLLKGSDLSLEVTTFPLLRAEKGMGDGQIDVMIRAKSWTKDPENYYWSEAIIHNRDVILSHLNAPLKFASIDALKGKRIGTIHGFKYPTLEPLFASKKLERIDAQNTANSLQMLLRHHVDGIVISEAVARWMIRNDQSLKDKFYFSKNTIDQNSIEYRFRKDDKLLPIIKRVNEALAKSKKDGSFEKLIQSYQ